MLSRYPAVAASEFEEAAKALHAAHAQSDEAGDWIELNCTRKEIFIRQRRDVLHSSHTAQSSTLAEEECEDVKDFEREDEELLPRSLPESPEHIFIDFSIVLSPTYQVPVLWFSSPSIPATRKDALDHVYDGIVSPASRTGLREIGVLGGISIAEHPNSGLPAFFIHPCRTQEALEVVRPSSDITPVEYMMLWLGIIGSPVGLSVPSTLARSISTPADTSPLFIAQPGDNDQDNSIL